MLAGRTRIIEFYMHVSASKAIRDAAAEGKQKLDLFETEMMYVFLWTRSILHLKLLYFSLAPLALSLLL